MSAAPPLSIPGYVWDGKRFYKAPKSAAKHTPASHSKTASPSPSFAGSTSSTARAESEGRRRKRARRTLEKGKWRAPELPQHNLYGLRDLGFSARFEGAVGAREQLHHDLRAVSLGRVATVKNFYPSTLPMSDEITHLAFDPYEPAVMRVGSSGGTISTGNLARAADDSAYYPNDEEGWRTSWYFPSKITSLKTSHDRMLITSLGPPAQAVVASTSSAVSLASVTLTPRKTSLWTSALSRDLVALGCDGKVLVTQDAGRAGGAMEGYTTGGNRGDGTVFALELCKDLIFAGTRKGKIHLFDRRSSRPSPASSSSAFTSHISKDEFNLTLSSPITHLRHIKEQPYLLLAAGLDGFLGVFDLRFPSRPSPSSPPSAPSQPLLRLKGHANSISFNLGLDVWRDEFVVAAGQDARLRLWSLRSGALLSPSSSSAGASSTFSTSTSASSARPALPPGVSAAFSSLRTYAPSSTTSSALSLSAQDPDPNPFLRAFPAALKSVAFSPLDPSRLEEKAYAARAAERRERELGGEGEGEEEGWREELGRWGMPSLWVAEGGGVEGFGAR
ncbi:hypothetical protein JCM10207_002567 [Rhodosporidiobolus poonsookiae]